MRIFERTLDTAKAPVILDEKGILQSNKNIQFVIKLAENEQPVTIQSYL